MATTADDLRSFNQFVAEHSDPNASESRIAELFDLWSLKNPSDEAQAENVAAVAASIDDFLNGERGTPAGEHSNELRAEFGIGNE
mgnify:CR=1 FL=1|jgi:hypothetical protein